MSVDRHQIHEESVGAYLLGALEEAEVAPFEEHLDECPVCRDEIERLRPAVDALPRSVAQVQPSPGLKTALMAQIEAEAELEHGAPAQPKSRGSFLDRFRAGSRTAWAASALAVVAIAAGAFALGRNDAASGDHVVTAKVSGMPGATASVSIPDDGDAATLRVHGMPSLPPGQTYQAWVQRGDEVIPGSLFNVGSDGNGATAVDTDLRGADAVMLTREPSRGSRSPSGEPVLAISL